MNMGATFYNGGPQTLTWGILAVIGGALVQALSLAELAAIQPIAGAQYHWTDLLAPERHRRLITWMQVSICDVLSMWCYFQACFCFLYTYPFNRSKRPQAPPIYPQ